ARRQLLVLDFMAPATDPRLGLPDDAAADVQADLDAVPDDRRLVLCAASPYQTTLASPEMGRTVFGWYFEQGLRGWADGYGPDGRRDGQVTATELAEFVRARVARWAWRNRQTRQLPVLLGNGG